jgi:hypothetical protein
MRKQMGAADEGIYVVTRADTGFTHFLVGGEDDRAAIDARFDVEFWDGAAPE